ncbi:MAG: hypothetical protein ACMXYK_05160 [Candidatus Woesearchaeota archaeon]
MKSNIRFSKMLVFLLLVVLFGIIFWYGLRLISIGGLLSWDEPVYLSNARSLLYESHHEETFRFPLLSMFIAGVWFFTGESIIVAQISMSIISLLTLLVFFLLLKTLFSSGFALYGTFLFALSSQFLLWFTRIYTDVLGMFFVISSLYFLVKVYETSRVLNRKSKKKVRGEFLQQRLVFYVSFSGALGALAFLTRLSTIIPVLLCAFFVLLSIKSVKLFFQYGLGFFFTLLPFLIRDLFLRGNAFFFILAQTQAILEYTTFQSPKLFFEFMFLEYSWGIYLSLFVMLFLVCFFIYGLVTYIKEQYFVLDKKNNPISQKGSQRFKILSVCKVAFLRHKKTVSFAWVFSVLLIAQVLFYTLYVRLKFARYLLELSPFIIFLIVFFFWSVLLSLKQIQTYVIAKRNVSRKKLRLQNLGLGVSFLCVLFFMILLPWSMGQHSYEHLRNFEVHQTCVSQGSVFESLEYLDNLVNPGDVIVSSIWVYNGYYNNVNAYSFWTYDFGYLILKYGPSHIVLSSRAGFPYTKDYVPSDLLKELRYFEDACGFDVTIYEVLY